MYKRQPLEFLLSMKKFRGTDGSLRFGVANAGKMAYLGDGLVEAPPGKIRTRYGAMGTTVYPNGEVRFEHYADPKPVPSVSK